VAAIALAALPAQAAPPAGEGWVSMFNGKDLTGWKVPSNAKDVWTVAEGAIDCFPRRGREGETSLWSEKELGDFQLYVEWKIKDTKGDYTGPELLPDGTEKKDADGKPVIVTFPNADSGIYLRGTPKSQVNIWCWPIGSGEVYGYRTDSNMSAEVRAGVTPKLRADKPVGEWNTFLITMKGDRLTVELNGKTVIDSAQLPGVPPAGPIALQMHGGYDEKTNTWDGASSLVQFRDIYYKEL
jgi:hypothetical protein